MNGGFTTGTPCRLAAHAIVPRAPRLRRWHHKGKASRIARVPVAMRSGTLARRGGAGIGPLDADSCSGTTGPPQRGARNLTSVPPKRRPSSTNFRLVDSYERASAQTLHWSPLWSGLRSFTGMHPDGEVAPIPDLSALAGGTFDPSRSESAHRKVPQADPPQRPQPGKVGHSGRANTAAPAGWIRRIVDARSQCNERWRTWEGWTARLQR
jgi:hypothetical protein